MALAKGHGKGFDGLRVILMGHSPLMAPSPISPNTDARLPLAQEGR